jgi:hypothetical protein
MFFLLQNLRTRGRNRFFPEAGSEIGEKGEVGALAQIIYTYLSKYKYDKIKYKKFKSKKY